MMVRLFLSCLVLALVPVSMCAQHRMDTLYIADVARLEKATEIYVVPHPRYTLDHFVVAREREGVSRVTQRNHGDVLEAETKALLNQFKPGDRLRFRKVGAINRDAPERGLVRLKAMEWLVL